MIKVLGLFRKKPGMTREAFIDRYENPEYGHAQFAIKLCPWQMDYRRNFICDALPSPYAHLETSRNRPEMDVVMITKAKDDAQAQLTADALADPEVGQKIAKDEEALFDRTKMTIIRVDECATPAEDLRPRPPAYTGEPALKMLCFARMQDRTASRDEFIRSYENGLAKLLTSILRMDAQPILAGYVRNYVNHDAFANQGHVTVMPPKANFDVMDEIWFWTHDDYRKFQEACRDPAIGKKLAAEQSRLFDTSSITAVFVEEYVHTKQMLEAALLAHEAMARRNVELR